MNVSDFVVPVNNVYLSSAFTNRVKPGNAVFVKKELTVEEAKALCALFEKAANVKFINAINPRHESTAALAQGLTSLPCQQMFINALVGDVIIIMQPAPASRDATEFDLKHFEECVFELVQVCDERILKGINLPK